MRLEKPPWTGLSSQCSFRPVPTQFTVLGQAQFNWNFPRWPGSLQSVPRFAMTSGFAGTRWVFAHRTDSGGEGRHTDTIVSLLASVGEERYLDPVGYFVHLHAHRSCTYTCHTSLLVCTFLRFILVAASKQEIVCLVWRSFNLVHVKRIVKGQKEPERCVASGYWRDVSFGGGPLFTWQNVVEFCVRGSIMWWSVHLRLPWILMDCIEIWFLLAWGRMSFCKSYLASFMQIFAGLIDDFVCFAFVQFVCVWPGTSCMLLRTPTGLFFRWLTCQKGVYWCISGGFIHNCGAEILPFIFKVCAGLQKWHCAFMWGLWEEMHCDLRAFFGWCICFGEHAHTTSALYGCWISIFQADICCLWMRLGTWSRCFCHVIWDG